MSLENTENTNRFVWLFIAGFFIFLFILTQLQPVGLYSLSFQRIARTAPVILAFDVSPNPVESGEEVEFSVFAIDEEGDDLIYEWVFGDGEEAVTEEDEISYVYTVEAGTIAEFEVTARVDDGQRKSQKHRVLLVVEGPALPTRPLPDNSAGDDLRIPDEDPADGTANTDDEKNIPVEIEPAQPPAEEDTDLVPIQDGILDGVLNPGPDVSVPEPEVVNTRPVINRFESNLEQGSEDTPLAFSVDALDNESNPLVFTWNFGDGTPEVVTHEPNVFHSFRLGPLDPVRTFEVRVVVSDGELTQTRTLEVTVERAFLLVNIIEPVLDPTQKNNKVEPVNIAIQLLDFQFQPVSAANVTASVAGQDLVIDNDGEGIFTGIFRPTKETPNLEYLTVQASAFLSGQPRATRASSLMLFDPVPLVVENPFKNKTFTLGERVQEVIVPIWYRDGSKVSNAAVQMFFSNGVDRWPIDSVETDTGYRATSLDYRLTLKDVDPRLEVEALDQFGNELPLTVFSLTVAKDNPVFDLVLISPTSTTPIGPMQEVILVAELSSNALSDLRSTQVFVQIPELNETVALSWDSETKTFVGSTVLPSDIPSAALSFNLIGSTIANGNLAFDQDAVQSPVSTELQINFVHPNDGSSPLDLDNPNRLRVQLRYPDETLVTVPEVDALFTDNNQTQLIRLEFDAETEQYFAHLAEPFAEDEHILELELQGIFSGKQSIAAQIVNPLLIQGLIVGLFILAVIIYLGYAMRREKVRRKQKLMLRRDQLIALIKQLPFEFYKRHISEAEFKDKLLKSQKELQVLEKEMGLPPTKIKMP